MGKQIEKVNHQLAHVHQIGGLLEAMQSAKICEIPPIELDTVLMTAVHRAYRDKGQDVACEDMDYIVDNLCERVLSACPFVRIAEIPIAIEKGILGDYGDYYGLNVNTFVSFIRSHYNSLKRASLAKQTQPKEEEKPIPTEEEQKKTQRQVIVNAFEGYRKNGSYTDYGAYIYKSLKSMNVFNFSEERQKKFLEKGKERVLSSLRTDMQRNPHERNKCKRLMDEAMNIGKDKTEGKTMVYNAALQIALNRFFDDLIEMEQDITDFLTD